MLKALGVRRKSKVEYRGKKFDTRSPIFAFRSSIPDSLPSGS